MQAPSPSAASSPGGSQQAAEQTRNACNSQQCGETGCSSSGGADLPAAAAAEAAVAPGTMCMKCRKQEAEVVARGREPLCYPCLHEQLLSKVRNAVRMHGLIQPGDSVALAYSGGLGSAALLHFLTELRNPRTDRPARGKVSFSLHIVHIDDSAAQGLSEQQQAAARDRLAEAAQRYGGEPGVQYHSIPLESIFAEAGEQLGSGADGSTANAAAQGASSQQQQHWRQQLQALLAAVPDATGRDDLAHHLRTQLLLRTAARLGCSRLARGDSATALATHIVAAAAKGCGYSLPGDIHLLDARYGPKLPSVFCPLREVSSRELALVCSHWHLPLPATQPTASRAEDEAGAGAASDGGRSTAKGKQNINSLAAAFIAGMEAHNPGSVPNILNTISKLQAFPWNDPALAGQQQQQQPRRGDRQQQHQQLQQPAEVEAEVEDASRPQQQQHLSAVLCPICLSPLADDELPGSGSSGSGSGDSAATAANGHTSGRGIAAASGCCLSCSSQILGLDPAAAAAAGADAASSVTAALPAAVQQQMAALRAAGMRMAAAEESGDAAAPAADAADRVERLRAQIAEFLLTE